MEILDSKKLHEVNGGSKIAVGLLIAAGVTFIIGVIDGFVRPLRCN
ncbi:MAG: hypothetical protein J6D28_01860 [Bacilli bacterium]|nr:hypothetical protein [Bacilli bacterium]